MVESVFDLYKYCANCRHRLHARGHSKVCPNCGKKYFFNSRPTISVIIVNDKDELLLVKRKDEPFKGWWDLPGGFVDENEKLEAAAKRELQEEVGVVIEEFEYLGSFAENYEYINNIYPVVAAVFRASLSSGYMIKVGDDVSDYRFFPKKTVPIEKVAFTNQSHFLKNFLAQK